MDTGLNDSGMQIDLSDILAIHLTYLIYFWLLKINEKLSGHHFDNNENVFVDHFLEVQDKEGIHSP